MKRILLTGSEGYIGQNIREYFKDREGYSIKGIDSRMGIEAQEYKDFVKDGIHGIIHLAATSGIVPCERAPQEAVVNNFWTCQNMFESSLIHDIPCVFTSSQAAKEPMSSMYALTKYTSEVAANIFLDKGADIKVLRLTNVYGGYGYLRKKKTVVQKFAIATMKNEPKILNGNGLQARDLIHIEDVCRAIHLSLESGIVDIPVDIGTGIETTMLDLAQMFGGTFTFNTESDTIGLKSSVAEIEDAKKYLSFEAVHKIEDYVKIISNFSMNEIAELNL
jgi:nucleoside-diphosphate-sugar epimerase